jgi:hypothetical protein
MTSRWLLHLAFAFVLLFAQQGAVTHALTHLAEHAGQEKHLPHSPACEQCVAYAGIGAAPAPAALVFAALLAAGLLSAALPLWFFSVPRRFYRSRAPPFPV